MRRPHSHVTMTSRELNSSHPLPPGTFGLPGIGETFDFLRDSQFAKTRYQKYGPVFKTHILGKPTIFLQGIEGNQFVLTNENQLFSVTWPASTKTLLGSLSLALQTGAEHQVRRKLLAQAFLPRALSGYVTAMDEITRRYLQRWETQGTLTWYPELRNYTFDIACKLLIGLDFGSETSLGKQFEAWSGGLFSIPINLPWTRFGRALRSRHQLLQDVETIIRDRQQSSDFGNDALGLLIQARDDEGNSLSIEELKDQILLLLFAGHETLTSALASFCLLMTQHPTVMNLIREEQQQFAQLSPPTLEQLKQMTYLEQVLREVLRLIPPVGGGFRQVLQTCEFKGYKIPAGWNVLYQIGMTHQDSDLYPDPQQFNPERFAVGQSLEQQKFGYVPFGGGIRECIGKEFARLEMKLLAAHLARHYEWELLPNQDIGMIARPVPHPQDGLQVKFRRQQTS